METVIRALPSGTLIHGRYEILKVLGAGGFGVTYQAVDRKNGMVIAIKEYMPVDMAVRRPGTLEVLPQNGCRENYERFRNRFLEEAKLMYQYREHPNIIQVKHLFYENNTAYYVMEYMEGMDLQKTLEKKKKEALACASFRVELNGFLDTYGGSMSWSELKPFMAQAVSALELIHKSGTVHCDISPDNLFIMQNGQLKLIDFGAAKKLMKGPSSVILLKRGFSPPEQFTSRGQIGPWTDIYALAVTIYRSFTGQMPPSAPDRLAGSSVMPLELMDYLGSPSYEWEAVLKKAMALKVEERYQNVREFWNDLMGAVSLADISDSDNAAGAYTISKAHFEPIGGRRIPDGLSLKGIQGYFQGREIIPLPQGTETIFGTDARLGTDFRRGAVCYPKNTPGVSRVHMRIWRDERKLYAMDMGSTYGTFLNGKPMTAGLVYELTEGMVIQFGNGQIFKVVVHWRYS